MLAKLEVVDQDGCFPAHELRAQTLAEQRVERDQRRVGRSRRLTSSGTRARGQPVSVRRVGDDQTRHNGIDAGGASQAGELTAFDAHELA